jgi:hypothetical protein
MEKTKKPHPEIEQRKKPLPNFVGRRGDYGDDYSDHEIKQMKAWNEELKTNYMYRGAR